MKTGVIEGMVHPVQMGKRTRMSFARVEEALAVPDLIEVQKNSYRSFLKDGLREALADASPIEDYSKTMYLEFVDYSLDEEPKYTVEKCKERDTTFAAPLKVTVRLTNRDTHEMKESEVFMGDFPLMTEHGTFIINGAERVIVSPAGAFAGRLLFQDHRQDRHGAVFVPDDSEPRRVDRVRNRFQRRRVRPHRPRAQAAGDGAAARDGRSRPTTEIIRAVRRRTSACQRHDHPRRALRERQGRTPLPSPAAIRR